MKPREQKRIAAVTGRRAQDGFTLTEVLIAIVVFLVGVIAVAQLVPASIVSNSANRNDSMAMVFAQRELGAMLEQPLSAVSFTDVQGILCPLGNTCNLGDPANPNQVVGSPVVVIANRPVIDFTGAQVPNYSFNYQDPNDPAGATYDVRWAVITTVNNSGLVTNKRFILGTQKRGGNGFYQPVTLDTMVEK
jgi:prepilin-type N-terminal cleavage/methylation domain-containing protein